MATVKIGERELEVRHATLGMLRNDILPAQRKIVEVSSQEQQIDAMVDLLLLYVGHNAGIDRDFILANVDADPRVAIRACVAASGQRVAESGEAPRP